MFKRTALALLTGNGDLHFENLSMLGPREAKLSPVYDPAPMRAWARHDMLTVVPFAGVAGGQGALPADLGRRLRQLGEACPQVAWRRRHRRRRGMPGRDR